MLIHTVERGISGVSNGFYWANTIQKNYDDHWKIASISKNEVFWRLSEIYSLGFDAALKLRPEMVELGARDLLKPMDEKQSKSYTLSVTYFYLNFVVPMFISSRTERRLEAYEQLVLTAARVSQYFASNDRLPQSLEQAGVNDAMDPFALDNGLIYRPQNKSFLIYSIGSDFEDDGGVDDPREGDLTIRVN